MQSWEMTMNSSYVDGVGTDKQINLGKYGVLAVLLGKKCNL